MSSKINYEIKYQYICIHCDPFDIFKCGKNKNPYSFMGYFGNPSYIFTVRELIKTVYLIRRYSFGAKPSKPIG